MRIHSCEFVKVIVRVVMCLPFSCDRRLSQYPISTPSGFPVIFAWICCCKASNCAAVLPLKIVVTSLATDSWIPSLLPTAGKKKSNLRLQEDKGENNRQFTRIRGKIRLIFLTNFILSTFQLPELVQLILYDHRYVVPVIQVLASL